MLGSVYLQTSIFLPSRYSSRNASPNQRSLCDEPKQRRLRRLAGMRCDANTADFSYAVNYAVYVDTELPRSKIWAQAEK